jgi:hypothetical protein
VTLLQKALNNEKFSPEILPCVPCPTLLVDSTHTLETLPLLTSRRCSRLADFKRSCMNGSRWQFK